MKKIGIIITSVFACLLMTGCAVHSGTLGSSVVVSETTSFSRRGLTGESKAFYILGFGGGLGRNMVEDAKRDLIKKNNLQPGEELVNISVNWRQSWYFPIIIAENKCVVTADVVRFGAQGQPISKESSVSITADPKAEANLKLYQTLSIDDPVSEGDKVMFMKDGKALKGTLKSMDAPSGKCAIWAQGGKTYSDVSLDDVRLLKTEK